MGALVQTAGICAGIVHSLAGADAKTHPIDVAISLLEEVKRADGDPNSLFNQSPPAGSRQLMET